MPVKRQRLVAAEPEEGHVIVAFRVSGTDPGLDLVQIRRAGSRSRNQGDV